MAGDDRKLYVETITDVIDHYGYEQVTERLNVRPDDLERWIAGERRPPMEVFLQIVQLKAGAKRHAHCSRTAEGTASWRGSRADFTWRLDDMRINLEREHELNHWAKKFGVSSEEVRKAVQAAGPMVNDVQRYVRR